MAREKPYWTTTEICDRLRVSPRTLLRWQKERGFPRPLLAGCGKSENRYRSKDVLAWEDSLGSAA